MSFHTFSGLDINRNWSIIDPNRIAPTEGSDILDLNRASIAADQISVDVFVYLIGHNHKMTISQGLSAVVVLSVL